jgi:tRNA 2-thiouridine synthesizing protein B
MPKVLFTLLKSPLEKDETQTMNSIARDNEKGVLLFQDAVYYATIVEKRNELLVKNYTIYAIEEELEARGYQKFTALGVEIIDYETAVDMIMENYDLVISL